MDNEIKQLVQTLNDDRDSFRLRQIVLGSGVTEQRIPTSSDSDEAALNRLLNGAVFDKVPPKYTHPPSLDRAGLPTLRNHHR
jgi:hypothetical protein